MSKHLAHDGKRLWAQRHKLADQRAETKSDVWRLLSRRKETKSARQRAETKAATGGESIVVCEKHRASSCEQLAAGTELGTTVPVPKEMAVGCGRRVNQVTVCDFVRASILGLCVHPNPV